MPRPFLSILALTLAGVSAAQTGSPPPPAPLPTDTSRPTAQDKPFVFKSDVSLVTFTATITDPSGRYVRGLTPQTVAVWEDGQRQKVALFKDEVEPVSLGIIFDTSGSMERKIHDVIDAVTHFGATTQPGDEIFLMRFASDIELVMDFTGDRNRLGAAASGLRAGGGTALYDAVAAGLDKVLTGRHRKKALVVISDGNDRNSRTRLADALEMARTAEVLVYCVGIGDLAGEVESDRGPSILRGRWPIPNIRIGRSAGSGSRGREEQVDMGVLNSIAEAGGARAYLVPTAANGGVDKIGQVTQEISAELRQQYTIGYYPANAAHDGSYRRIQITTSYPELTVRARRGYYAAKD